jgi:hypothetical protein
MNWKPISHRAEYIGRKTHHDETTGGASGRDIRRTVGCVHPMGDLFYNCRKAGKRRRIFI